MGHRTTWLHTLSGHGDQDRSGPRCFFILFLSSVCCPRLQTPSAPGTPTRRSQLPPSSASSSSLDRPARAWPRDGRAHGSASRTSSVDVRRHGRPSARTGHARRRVPYRRRLPCGHFLWSSPRSWPASPYGSTRSKTLSALQSVGEPARRCLLLRLVRHVNAFVLKRFPTSCPRCPLDGGRICARRSGGRPATAIFATRTVGRAPARLAFLLGASRLLLFNHGQLLASAAGDRLFIQRAGTRGEIRAQSAHVWRACACLT